MPYYAAPLELTMGIDPCSNNIPLLTELFRIFSKHNFYIVEAT
ncbi:MAG: hypothetical protein JETT_0440 [Candidatus Jettenia ecosi]|uniref:Uncharacterized protein n=1 Tax=Candidatus Jettenia ecosi TaxID=2494326 RepID=A0A533QKH0_9BACT|nr:MAG: hypothetical protein JETT_0440 [Candidatus Jettenia ecosi]